MSRQVGAESIEPNDFLPGICSSCGRPLGPDNFLTPVEKQIRDMLVKGLKVNFIAKRMKMNKGTIYSLRRKIIAKCMGLQDVETLIKAALILEERNSKLHDLVRSYDVNAKKEAFTDPNKLAFYPERQLIAFRGKTLSLTMTQFAVVECLAKNMGKVVSYENLYNDLYGLKPESDQPFMKILGTLVSRLRNPLRTVGFDIKTQWGVGYFLVKTEGGKQWSIRSRLTETNLAHLA